MSEKICITYKYSDDGKKCLYFCKSIDGKVEACEDKEAADGYLESDQEDQKDSLEEIVSKIPEFKDLSEGDTATICESVEDLKSKYDIDLELIEEEVHEDLDGDSEKGESEEHKEKVLGKDEEYDLSDSLELEEPPTETDPSDVMHMEFEIVPESKNHEDYDPFTIARSWK